MGGSSSLKFSQASKDLSSMELLAKYAVRHRRGSGIVVIQGRVRGGKGMMVRGWWLKVMVILIVNCYLFIISVIIMMNYVN